MNKSTRHMLRSLHLCVSVQRRLVGAIPQLRSQIRGITSVSTPEYPSPKNEELMNEEFNEIFREGTKLELEDALQQNSPVGLLIAVSFVV